MRNKVLSHVALVSGYLVAVQALEVPACQLDESFVEKSGKVAGNQVTFAVAVVSRNFTAQEALEASGKVSSNQVVQRFS